jgi:hypothetical protein
MISNHFSKFKPSLDSIWVAKEVDLVVVNSLEVEADKDSNNNRERNHLQARIITKYLVLKETPLKKKLRKSLRKWQSNTIQIKTRKIQKAPKRNFRN